MLIIPAIDIMGGKCVRLTRGDYATKKVYSADPLKVAKQFEKEGADFIHIVDLDGAKAGRPMNQALIFRLRRSLKVPLEVGGGIRTLKVVQDYLDAGIDRVIIGTRALEDPKFLKSILKKFGPEKIVLGLDIRNGKVATHGWLNTSAIHYLTFARRIKRLGIQTIVCTDIARDGMLDYPEGANDYLRLQELKKVGFAVIASGGVASLENLKTLRDLGIDGAIIGKALYEKKLTLKQALSAVRPLSGLTKRIIPCLDIKNNRVVKGTHFKALQDAGDPVALGKKYSDSGADELVFLDITATADKRKTLTDLVERVARVIDIPFTVGGGIQSIEDIKVLLEKGADKISIGSAAVQNPALIKKASQAFGAQCIVISLDAKKKGRGWKVYIKGGREATPLDAIGFARQMEKLGAGELLVNSLDRDGTAKGFDIKLLKKISESVQIPVVASSGAGSQSDFLEVFKKTKVDAALGASLFHYKKLEIKSLKQFLKRYQIPVRL